MNKIDNYLRELDIYIDDVQKKNIEGKFFLFNSEYNLS